MTGGCSSKARDYFLYVVGQIAVVVNRVDERFTDQHFAGGESFDLQLPIEMLMQGLARFVSEFGDRSIFSIPAAVLRLFGYL